MPTETTRAVLVTKTRRKTTKRMNSKSPPLLNVLVVDLPKPSLSRLSRLLRVLRNARLLLRPWYRSLEVARCVKNFIFF